MGIELANDSDDYESYSEDEPVLKTGLARQFGFPSWSNIYNRVSSWGVVLGNLMWMMTTSVILIGLPVLYAYDREKNYEAYEAEQQRFKQS